MLLAANFILLCESHALLADAFFSSGRGKGNSLKLKGRNNSKDSYDPVVIAKCFDLFDCLFKSRLADVYLFALQGKS